MLFIRKKVIASSRLGLTTIVKVRFVIKNRYGFDKLIPRYTGTRPRAVLLSPPRAVYLAPREWFFKLTMSSLVGFNLLDISLDAFSTNSIKNPPTCFDERISLMLKETALI
jgi:hypothetical protein